MNKLDAILKTIKPSGIVDAMLRGLESLDTRKNFIFDVDTFGRSSGACSRDICAGCAAMLAVMELSGHNFLPSEINSATDRSQAVGCEDYMLLDFECAVDGLRDGYIGAVFKFVLYYSDASIFERHRENNKSNSDLVRNLINMFPANFIINDIRSAHNALPEIRKLRDALLENGL